MDYSFSKRDNNNRSTLTINGSKVGRVHFREYDAWLNPYETNRLKSKEDLERLGITVEYSSNDYVGTAKLFIDSTDEEKIATILAKAFRDV